MATSSVIFDLDGTLWDSYPFYAAALADGDANRYATALQH